MGNKSSGWGLLIKIFLGTFALVLVVAFVWAVPSFAQTQRESCNLLEAGISQFNNAAPSVQPMTAEMCIRAVDSGGAKMIRGFIGIVASFMASIPLTLIIIFGILLPLAKRLAKEPASKREE